MPRIRVLMTGLISAFFFSTILFVAAGKFTYTEGWIYLSVNIVSALMHFIAYPSNNELMEERSKVKEGAKSWDKKLLGVSAALYVINMIVSGLDSGRFHWSPLAGWQVYIPGIVLMLAGQTIFLTALRENKFFSSVVRIQKERGHTVCDTGIYRVVRHPGYLGMIISLAGIPFVLGSIWSAIPTLIAIILLFVRTELEDKTLREELAGYSEYSARIHKKLIPFIW